MVHVFQVIGIDFGGRFIDTAIKIQRGEEVQFKLSNGDTMLAQVNGNTMMQRAVFKQVRFICFFYSLFICFRKFKSQETI